MLDYPRHAPLVTEKVRNGRCTKPMQCSSGTFLSVTCLGVYRAAVPAGRLKDYGPLLEITEGLTCAVTVGAEALS